MTNLGFILKIRSNIKVSYIGNVLIKINGTPKHEPVFNLLRRVIGPKLNFLQAYLALIPVS